ATRVRLPQPDDRRLPQASDSHDSLFCPDPAASGRPGQPAAFDHPVQGDPGNGGHVTGDVCNGSECAPAVACPGPAAAGAAGRRAQSAGRDDLFDPGLTAAAQRVHLVHAGAPPQNPQLTYNEHHSTLWMRRYYAAHSAHYWTDL